MCHGASFYIGLDPHHCENLLRSLPHGSTSSHYHTGHTWNLKRTHWTIASLLSDGQNNQHPVATWIELAKRRHHSLSSERLGGYSNWVRMGRHQNIAPRVQLTSVEWNSITWKPPRSDMKRSFLLPGRKPELSSSFVAVQNAHSDLVTVAKGFLFKARCRSSQFRMLSSHPMILFCFHGHQLYCTPHSLSPSSFTSACAGEGPEALIGGHPNSFSNSCPSADSALSPLIGEAVREAWSHGLKWCVGKAVPEPNFPIPAPHAVWASSVDQMPDRDPSAICGL